VSVARAGGIPQQDGPPGRLRVLRRPSLDELDGRPAPRSVERFASDHEQLRDDDAFWAEMHANFTATEIVDLCYQMVGPQLGRLLMGKVLLGFNDFCEVSLLAPSRATDLV